MKIRAIAIASILLSTGACADEASPPAPETHRAGPLTPVELDFQLGTFTGGRLQAIVYRGEAFTFNVEGLYGSNLVVFEPFSDGSSTSWGAGVRLNHPLSDGGGNGWGIAPGLDFYDANSHGASFVSPNVDLAYTHDFSRYFGLVFGLKGGVEIGMGGHSDTGESYSGKSLADIGIYLGARF